MSEEQTILVELQRIFAKVLLVEVSSVDADLFEGGALDSMGLVELLVQLEKRFGCRLSIQELELEDFSSIRRIATLVAARKRNTARQKV